MALWHGVTLADEMILNNFTLVSAHLNAAQKNTQVRIVDGVITEVTTVPLRPYNPAATIIEGEGTIDEEDDEEDAKRVIGESRGIIPERGGFNRAKVVNIQPMSVGKDIKAQLDNLNVAKVKESLLQKRNTNRDSLLSKGE